MKGSPDMVKQERIVKNLMRYVSIDSETGSEGKFAKVLINALNELGLEVYVDDAGEKVGSDTGNVIARLKGDKSAPGILFCCHMDTVRPGKGIKPVVRDDTIYSDGSTILGSDDKAGIAVAMEALAIVKEEKIPHGDIEIVFDIAEEGGLNGTKNLDYSKINSKIAFILDGSGPPGGIVIQGPAHDRIYVKIIGKAAHAGARPEQGISAIQVAATAISRMKLLRVDEETTANIGIIKGGTATNIVCPEVEINAEARSQSIEKLESQVSHMLNLFKDTANTFGARVSSEVKREYNCFKVEKTDNIVKTVLKACDNIGLKGYTKISGGGTDAHILAEKGIKTVNLTRGGDKSHSVEEHIKIKDLVESARLVLEIIKIIE